MPLNEATHVLRERWPLEFDLEGVSASTAERERLIQSRREMNNIPLVPNTFAVDYQAGNNVIDINNPPSPYRANPGGRYVYQEFPKMLYPANYPKAKPITVNSAAEKQAALKKGFLLKPPIEGSESTSV